MSQHVQLLRHDGTGANAYTGPEGELTADTSNKQLRLHDGETPGGFRFIPLNVMVTLFQAQSDELSGLEGFSAQAKGMLVRKGAGQYVIRKLIGTDGQIEITNQNGFDGNPQVALAETITGDRTFDGTITFTQPIQGPGIEGDVLGNVEGNLLGDVMGNVIGNLTGDSNGAHTGDVDVRGANFQVDDGQIPFSALSGVPAPPDAIPTGGVILWSGAADEIPDGWFLCDGNNGTPNLLNRFIVGAGDAYAVNASGGTSTHTHVSEVEDSGVHDHNITVDGHALTTAEMPSHSHPSGVTDNSQTDVFNHGNVGASPTTGNSIESNGADGIYEGITGLTGGASAHSHSASADDSGNHSHNISVQNANHIPPYYALCYIMKGP